MQVDLGHLAGLQVAELVRAVGDPDQPVDAQAKRLQHLAHLAVLAFGERKRDPAIDPFARLRLQPGLDRAIDHAINAQAAAQAIERLLRHLAARASPVAPREPARRQLQRPRQAAVIGQQKQALGIQIQPADRDHPGQAAGQMLEHGRAALGIAMGGDQADRLVIAPEPRRLGRANDPAIDRQHIARVHLDRRRGQNLAVQPHPAGGDQPLHLAAGCDARPGQGLGHALARGLTRRGGGVWVRGMIDHDLSTMRIALAEAQAAADAGETPVGAVVIDPVTGQVVARAHNQPIGSADPTAHAEILALRAAARAIGNYRLSGLELFVTLEPCAMCAGAISHARIGRLVFGAKDEKGGAILHGPRFFDQPTCHWRPAVVGDVLGAESSTILRAFFRNKRIK